MVRSLAEQGIYLFSKEFRLGESLSGSCSIGKSAACSSGLKQPGCKAVHSFLPRAKVNPLNAELNPICYLLALLAHHFFHVSTIRVKSLTLRLLIFYIYIYGAHILDVSRSHTMHHSR